MVLIHLNAVISTAPSGSYKVNVRLLLMALSLQPLHLPLYQQQQHSSFSSTLILSHTSLPSPNIASSTISIRDACKQGNLKQVFLSLAHSQFPPPQEAYSSVLELCASRRAPFEGQQLHSHILKANSLLSDGFLGTRLVFMYGKCDRLLDAEKLFDEMPRRSVFTWNALIGAYASAGHSPLAVASYQEMRFSGIYPDACTLASVLKACAAADRVCIGTEIHGLAVKSGLDVTGLVSNALISMYAKCGHFSSARQLFKRMGVKKDVVSWNSMMSACLQDGQFFETLNLFREMRKDGIQMNSYTAVVLLQACTELSLAKLGMEMHAYFLKNTCTLHIFERNALVVLYTRCGLIGNAVGVFNEMDERDNVSWNSMLSGYVQNGLYQVAIEFFSEAIQQGFKPDQVSLVSVAAASGRLGNVLNGKEVHAYAIKHGFDADLLVGNTLIDMYTKCHFIGYAEHVFHKLHTKDCISWTTMIAGYAQSGYYSKALELSREEQKDGMKLDPMMVGSILQACSGLLCLPLLKQVHGYAIRNRLLDLVLENTIVDAYGECGKVGYAYHVFRMVQDKDVISWTSMITCYANNGLLNEALSLFKEMVEANVEPDVVSLISVLAATAGLSSYMKGKQIHGFLYRRQFVTDGTALNSSLVDMYAQCGDIENAFKVFDNVRCRDLVLWTTMINACGLHGRGEDATSLFRKMHEMDIIPDHVAFLALLYACSHSGLISEGKRYLRKMTSEYGLDPWPEHYACVVDLLGRSAQIEEAYNFIKSMPVEPTAVVWCALLGACRVHRNHKVGKIAAKKLLELEPETSGNYVLVSNVFAAMGEWKDVNAVRRMMEERGLKKDPACSWIEVGNRLHTFVARDTSHKDSAAIYTKLAEITDKLKREGGYVENTRFVLHDVTEEDKVRMLHGHSERLAIAFGMLYAPKGTPIRITKNLRVCGDCHEFTRLVTKFYDQEIIVRDANRFHHFKGGSCSCGNFW